MIEGMIAVKRGKEWGWINESGEILIPLEWDGVGAFNQGGLAPVCRDELWGVIDRKGKIIILPRYSSLTLQGEGLAIVENEGRFGVIRIDGNSIVPIQWDAIWDFDTYGMAMVCKDGKYGWIDRMGNPVIKPEWDRSWEFDSKGMALVYKKDCDRMGWIDRDGKVVLPLNWILAQSFESSAVWKFPSLKDPDMTRVRVGNVFEQGKVLTASERETVDGGWGLIDRDGNYLVEPNWGFEFIPLGLGWVAAEGADWEDHGAMFNLKSGESVPVKNRLLPFDTRNRAWEVTLGADIGAIDDTFLIGFRNDSGRSVFRLPKGRWYPTIWSYRRRNMAEFTSDISWIEDGLSLMGTHLYAVSKTVPVSPWRTRIHKWKGWIGLGEDEPLPELEELCHAYDADGNIVWSSAWLPFESKCWLVFGFAVFVAFIARPRRDKGETKLADDG